MKRFSSPVLPLNQRSYFVGVAGFPFTEKLAHVDGMISFLKRSSFLFDGEANKSLTHISLI